MTKLSLPIVSTFIALHPVTSLAYAQATDKTSEPKVKVDDNSFKCITDMTPVRHFYVDNLLGNVEATVAVATAGKGNYPAGSVLQLMPNEVMIKHQEGFNPETHDWEFFYIDVDKNGSKIFARGFADEVLRLTALSLASVATECGGERVRVAVLRSAARSDDVRRVYRRRLLPFSAFSSLFWRKAFPDLARE
jgi:hypothetical protein